MTPDGRSELPWKTCIIFLHGACTSLVSPAINSAAADEALRLTDIGSRFIRAVLGVAMAGVDTAENDRELTELHIRSITDSLPMPRFANYQAMVSARGHGKTADSLQVCHRLIGIPLVMLASIAGTASLGSTLINLGTSETWVTALTAAVSVTSGVLAGLQTLFNFAERSAKHAVAAANLSALAVKKEVSPEEVAKVIGEAPRVHLKTQKRAKLEIDEELGRRDIAPFVTNLIK
jgi:hypothetical protein